MENQITQAAQAICAAFQKGGKLLLCGNGGSAAIAPASPANWSRVF